MLEWVAFLPFKSNVLQLHGKGMEVRLFSSLFFSHQKQKEIDNMKHILCTHILNPMLPGVMDRNNDLRNRRKSCNQGNSQIKEIRVQARTVLSKDLRQEPLMKTKGEGKVHSLQGSVTIQPYNKK